MKPRALRALAGLLAGLCAAATLAWALSRPKDSAVLCETKPAAEATKLEIARPEGSFALEKRSGAWRLASPFDYAAEPGLSDTLAKLPRIRLSEALSEDPAGYGLFGLSSATATRVRLYAEGQLSLDFFVGNDGPDFPSFFMRLARETSVRQARGLSARDFARPLAEWLDKTVSAAQADAAASLSVRGEKAGFELHQESGAWLTGRPPKPVAAGAIDKTLKPALQAAARLEAARVVPAKSAEKTGLDRPTLAVELRLKDGKAPLVLKAGGKDASGYRWLEKAGETRVLFLIDDWRLDPLRKTSSDFLK